MNAAVTGSPSAGASLLVRFWVLAYVLVKGWSFGSWDGRGWSEPAAGGPSLDAGRRSSSAAADASLLARVGGGGFHVGNVLRRVEVPAFRLGEGEVVARIVGELFGVSEHVRVVGREVLPGRECDGRAVGHRHAQCALGVDDLHLRDGLSGYGKAPDETPSGASSTDCLLGGVAEIFELLVDLVDLLLRLVAVALGLLVVDEAGVLAVDLPLGEELLHGRVAGLSGRREGTLRCIGLGLVAVLDLGLQRLGLGVGLQRGLRCVG